jgi:hypothetical protein
MRQSDLRTLSNNASVDRTTEMGAQNMTYTILFIWGGAAVALAVADAVIKWFDDGSPDEWLSPWGKL